MNQALIVHQKLLNSQRLNGSYYRLGGKAEQTGSYRKCGSGVCLPRPSRGFGRMRFRSNGGWTRSVNARVALGGDTVVLPKSTRDYRGSTRDAQRSSSQPPGLLHAGLGVFPPEHRRSPPRSCKPVPDPNSPDGPREHPTRPLTLSRHLSGLTTATTSASGLRYFCAAALTWSRVTAS